MLASFMFLFFSS